MVKSNENGVSVQPFLLKCYEMVDDESTDELICWTETSDSFIIWDDGVFSAELLPKYFKHNNFSSFVRQLNIYGFRKIDTDRWEFANDGFIKGKKHLLKNINRRKQSQGPVQPKSSQQKDTDFGVSEENRTLVLQKEVESLKIDRNALMQELVKLRENQQTSRSKMLVVREQLKGMEKNQQQMLSFIVMAMQSSGFFVQLLQPKENNWRMAEPTKNILTEVADHHELVVPSDGMIVRYQPPMNESAEPLDEPTSNSEELLELDLSSDEVKDLFMNIDFMSGPLDENAFSLENQGPLILHDLPDGDYMLEQLLLSSPLSDNNEDVEIDTEDPIDSVELESKLCGTQPKESNQNKFLLEGLGKSQNMKIDITGLEAHLDNSEYMEVLTEQMGLLASESGCTH